MKLVVGLGNPGNKYQGTKHNIGFDVIDQLLKKNHLQLNEQKFRADYTVWHRQPEKVILAEPFTFMNLSGEAVLPLMTYYGVDYEDLLIIYDDLDMAPGKIRLRSQGSAGGHNGIKSLIAMLGSQDFQRIKIGIGRPDPGWKVADHVLAPFKPDHQPAIDRSITQAVEIVEDWLDGTDFTKLMNKYN